MRTYDDEELGLSDWTDDEVENDLAKTCAGNFPSLLLLKPLFRATATKTRRSVFADAALLLSPDF